MKYDSFLRVNKYFFSGDFLATLEDPDLNVRRVALVAFNSAAHNKPSLIRVIQFPNQILHNCELQNFVRDSEAKNVLLVY